MTVRDDETRVELVEHLAELRARLIRVFVYVVVGAIVGWAFYDQIFMLLTHPMAAVISHLNSKFLLTSFPEAFLIKMQICVISGLVIVFPLVIMEIWGFVSPGLTPDEKRPVKWVAPLSAFLFAFGVVLCYSILPFAFQWFVSYVPKNAELRPSVQGSVIFSVKMLLVFGILFQLPIIMMLLAKIGIVSSKMPWNQWRVAVVLIATVAAIATPSNDAFSMIMAAVPMVFLYFLGIFLVKLTERKRKYT